MDFRSLASGCRFSRKRPVSAPASGSSNTPVEGADVGALDFFGAEPSASKLEVEPTPEDKAASRRRRKEKKSQPSNLEEAPTEVVATEIPTLTLQAVAEANALRRTLHIHAYGTDIPPPLQSVQDLTDRFAAKPFLERNILAAGYHELTRVQMQAIPAILSR